jgi:hypothetical protein
LKKHSIKESSRWTSINWVGHAERRKKRKTVLHEEIGMKAGNPTGEGG